MMDFQIKKSARRCQATDRELTAGESFYSDLISDGDQYVRKDFCETAWEGPDENSIGWWKASIPKVDSGKVYWAPRDVLISYFESLLQGEQHCATAYVLALALIRKRILQLVDSQTADDGKSELLEVAYKKEGKTWNVTVVELTNEKIAKIQQELGEQLFMDHPPDSL